MADKDPSLTISATDKTGAAFASVTKKLNALGESSSKFTSFASAGGYAIAGLDGLGKAGQAAAAGISMTTMAMSALGGPAGILLGVVAGIAGYVFTTNKAVQETTDFNLRLQQLRGNMVAVRGIELSNEIAKTKKEVAELQEKWKTGANLFGSRDEYYKDQQAIRQGNALINALNRQLDENKQLQRAGVKDTKERQKAESDLNKEREKLAAEGRSIYEATRSPLEKLTSEHARLNSLLRQGAIDEDTRNRAMRAAIDLYDASLKKKQAPEDKDRAQLFGDFAKLEESLLSENERIRAHYEDQQFLVEEMFQEGALAQQDRNAILQQLELEHQAKMGNMEAQGALNRKAFEEKTAREKTKHILGEMISLTQGVAQHNKTLFEINKVAAIADAIMNTYAGVTLTMRTYPYPWNLPMAGLHLAAGLAQVSAIQSTSFGGGGGAGTTPSAAGSTPVVNSQPVPVAAVQTTSTKTVTITLNGAGYSKEAVRELIQSINEEVGDGVRLATA
jgi:hypothetical protein